MNILLVPDRRDWDVQFSHLDQVEWEDTRLEACTVVAF